MPETDEMLYTLLCTITLLATCVNLLINITMISNDFHLFGHPLNPRAEFGGTNLCMKTVLLLLSWIKFNQVDLIFIVKVQPGLVGKLATVQTQNCSVECSSSSHYNCFPMSSFSYDLQSEFVFACCTVCPCSSSLISWLFSIPLFHLFVPGYISFSTLLSLQESIRSKAYRHIFVVYWGLW